MIVLTTVLSIGICFAALSKLDILRIAGEAVETSRRGVAAMRDPSLDDLAREQTIRQISLRLFGAVGSLAARAALTAGLAFIPIGLASAAGLASPASVLRFLSTWQAAMLATFLAGAAYGIRMLPWRAN